MKENNTSELLEKAKAQFGLQHVEITDEDIQLVNGLASGGMTRSDAVAAVLKGIKETLSH